MLDCGETVMRSSCLFFRWGNEIISFISQKNRTGALNNLKLIENIFSMDTIKNISLLNFLRHIGK